SAMRACSAETTSMMTPPFSISARPTLVFGVDLSIVTLHSARAGGARRIAAAGQARNNLLAPRAARAAFRLSDSSHAGHGVGRAGVAALAEGREGAPQAARSLDEPLGRLAAEGEADAALAPLLDHVERARMDDDAPSLRLLEDRARVERRRQRHPERDAVLGAAPAERARQVAAEPLLQRVAAAPVLGERAAEVRGQVAALQELGERLLQELRAAEVDGVLERDQARPERGRRDDEADAQRRDEPLREGADVDDVAVERAHRGRRRAPVHVEVGDIVVLDE